MEEHLGRNTVGPAFHDIYDCFSNTVRVTLTALHAYGRGEAEFGVDTCIFLL